MSLFAPTLDNARPAGERHTAPSNRWLTISWMTTGVLGLALLVGSAMLRPDQATHQPQALASAPVGAVAVPRAVVDQVDHALADLADRVAALEAEVAELRSPMVAGVGR